MIWWRHQIETFSALLALCEGNLSAINGFPSQRSATQIFGVFFDLRLNTRLNKRSRRRWFGVQWCTSCVGATSFRRKNDVAASFRCDGGIVVALCVRWGHGLNPNQITSFTMYITECIYLNKILWILESLYPWFEAHRAHYDVIIMNYHEIDQPNTTDVYSNLYEVCNLKHHCEGNI